MDYDFVIVGGGIAGVSAAARLAPLGRVLLLEAEDALAHHASGRSAALYEPRYGAAPVVALSLASEADFRALPQVLSPRGLLLVAREDQRAAFDEDLEAMDFTRISFDEARARVPVLNPDTVALAGYAAHAEDIDTDLLLQSYARAARGHGAEVRLKGRVSGIRRLEGGWHVAWPGGEATGRMLVNAAGAWVDQVAVLAGIAPLGFTPLRRSMARIPAPEGMDVASWPMVFGPGEDWYMKPDAGALIVSPAEEDPVDAPHDAWADDMVLAEGLARYEEMVTAPVTRVLANWAGLRTFAPDRVPVIGPSPADPSFIWCAGQGGYGFQTSPAASLLLADLIAGRPPAIGAAVADALSPARLR
ncbi:NAD(P)/FAD-dependent oxidoreductase [Pseudogemmobacter humi]|uniref:Hydrogen cyanide synthase subunit HcnC n=1 Tax=Pseudogemmobacter humi TaxID=2483812 RepID=A0A3P5X360_9RHOB|nr:FAD-dependent oxidoreductase [Pseudogemmobacter humi]VDC28641.1 Hydrogen cyanide synthase subunit HcnC precursor [Pseudogemmobacter humi]